MPPASAGPRARIEQMCGNARAKRGHGMARASAGRLALVLTGALFLTACEEGSKVGSFFQKKESTPEGAAPAVSGETTGPNRVMPGSPA